MAVPSRRLERRVHTDFGERASLVLAELATVPETLPLARKQDPERLQAALVLPARGTLTEFSSRLSLARIDWRDALVAAGLADSDWSERLDRELGSNGAQ
jgi:hypothetical protein